MRLVADVIQFCAERVPKWNPISISGYHMREAGSTAVQEVAFTLANGLAYVDAALERGLAIDEFAPRLSFFFNAHNHFLEEVAKFRAARRLWAELVRERYAPRDERVAAPALPHPDRRLDAHRPAARDERRAGGDPGARRGLRRHPVAAHQRARRGAGAAHRGVGAARAAHPAGARRRDRRSPTSPTRSAAPGRSRRSPTRSRAARATTCGGSTRWGAPSPRSSAASSRERSPRPPTAGRARSRRAGGRWWASTATSSRASPRPSRSRSTRTRSATRSSACAPFAPRATEPRRPPRAPGLPTRRAAPRI